MDPFIAEIRIFGFNFAPVGWALCNGQLLAIQSNTALFSLLGVQYGGNGTTNFALPNLQGRASLGQGQGPGLSSYIIGETLGSENVTLLTSQIPSHNHAVSCYNDVGTDAQPGNNILAASGADRGQVMYNAATSGSTVGLNPSQLSVAGSGLPHNNRSPYTVLNFCIALFGVYPARN